MDRRAIAGASRRRPATAIAPRTTSRAAGARPRWLPVSSPAFPQTANKAPCRAVAPYAASDSAATAAAPRQPSTAMRSESWLLASHMPRRRAPHEKAGRRKPAVAIDLAARNRPSAVCRRQQRLTGAAAEGFSAALGEETQPTRAAQARDRVLAEPRERIAAQQVLNGLRGTDRIGVGTAYPLQLPQSRTLQTAPWIAPPGDRHRDQQNEHHTEAPPARCRRPPSRRGGRVFRSQIGEPIGVHAANCNASSAAVSS